MLELFSSPTFKYFGIFKEDAIATFTATAPPPERDFYHLNILKDKIFWRRWRITSRNEADKYSPAECSNTYSEFKQNSQLRGEIRQIMGSKVLRFCDYIVRGRLDFLPRMPPSIIKKILSFINVEDIVSLSRSCKAIAEICNDDDVWQKVYIRYHKDSPNDIVKELARTYSWKRVFFTSKLKLQMQIRRLRLEQGQPAGDEAIRATITSMTGDKPSGSEISRSLRSRETNIGEFSSLRSSN
uniref:F-box domain-containing protein n=2 Tax=Mesocestoides corti TaxID=53468 RepID=A0A5K3EIB5_MESCO